MLCTDIGRMRDSTMVSDMRIVGGTGGMPPEPIAGKMRNHNADDHKFASSLIIAYIYDAFIALFFGMTSILRLPKS